MTTSPLLMIPGPTPVDPDVLAALAEPVRSHTGPENAATMLRIQEGIRQLVGSANARVYCFAGAGTLAMEAALVNHASPGDRVVVEHRSSVPRPRRRGRPGPPSARARSR